MTKTARSSRASARVIPLRKGTTLEMIRLACPDTAQAQRISESFGLAILDSDGIRDLHERVVIDTADALKDGLSERAMHPPCPPSPETLATPRLSLCPASIIRWPWIPRKTVEPGWLGLNSVI